jgi:ABC-type Fe3+ transport system permease subunit
VKTEAAVLCLIMLFLMVFVPFASSNPDGLEKVVLTYSAQENQSPWSGLMADYSLGAVDNSYVSTVLAGIIGAIIVLLSTYLLGMVIETKKAPISETD